MKEVYEVTLTYTALVLAEDSEEARDIARQEQGEITSDMNPEIESGCSIRSRQELKAYTAMAGEGWDETCLPYGGDGKKTLDVVLEEFEEADAVAAAAFAVRCPNTVDMFEEPKPIAPAEPARPPDFRLMLARKFAGGDSDWNWCRMEFIGDGEGSAALIEGGVPNRGPDGKSRWTGVRTERVVVTESQVAAAALAWEQETGKCYVCAGSGQQCYGWNCETGNKFQDCGRCGATGQAVAS